MPFTIVRQDITRMKTDAIVNAANTDLLMGGGVCGAIFKAAGPARLQQECRQLAPIQTGQAVITSGCQLPARHIIHTAGPIYDARYPKRCEEQLRASYRNSLELADQNGLTSIAFPLISSGIYGYPKDKALQCAVEEIETFLQDHDMDVYLTVFDKSAFQLSRSLQKQIDSYIDENYVDAHPETRGRFTMSSPRMFQSAPILESLSGTAAPESIEIDTLLSNLDEPFSDTLLHLIDQKGKTDTEVYKKANIDRKLFSKIRSKKGYTPSKPTILALAIALELSLEETNMLLERAGYALSPSSKFDVIVEFFILNGIYNIFEINEYLFKYDQPLLGSLSTRT